MKLSLVVPCYNEEKNVRAFYDAATAVFDKEGYDYELVFVNDGSSDSTVDELKSIYFQSSHNIRIISFSRNFGKEAAMYAGIEHSVGDMVCLIDADLQQRPEIVADMVKTLDCDQNLDCVAAFQETRSSDKKLSMFKKGFYSLINSVSQTEFVQGASDFRTFRRSVADAVLSVGEYHRFSKGILSWVGFNTKYIPYQAQERHEGESKWSFKKLFSYAIDGIMAFSTAPLAIPLLLGLLFCVLSVGFAVVRGAVCFFSAANSFGFGSWLITLILMLGGLQLLSIGIIGKYLAKTYEQGKNRPIYIAKEILVKNDK